MPDDRYLAIGEFSRRVGVSTDLLRAWERRYGLPRPTRTANGRRLYSRSDELLVAAIRRAVEQGLPPAEAVRLAAAPAAEPTKRARPEPQLDTLAAGLRDALTRYDEGRAQ